MLKIMFVIVLVVIFIGALPTWSHSRNFGYYPSGISGVILVIILILILTGCF